MNNIYISEIGKDKYIVHNDTVICKARALYHNDKFLHIFMMNNGFYNIIDDNGLTYFDDKKFYDIELINTRYRSKFIILYDIKSIDNVLCFVKPFVDGPYYFVLNDTKDILYDNLLTFDMLYERNGFICLTHFNYNNETFISFKQNDIKTLYFNYKDISAPIKSFYMNFPIYRYVLIKFLIDKNSLYLIDDSGV